MQVLQSALAMPGDMGLPVLGRVWQMVSTEGHGLLADYRRYGSVFKSSLLGRPAAVLIGPEANRLVLQDSGERFSSQDGWAPFIEHLFGETMMLQDGERHRNTRRLMAPAFHSTAVASYMETMEQIFKDGFAAWQGQQALPIHQECRKLALVVGIHLLLGVQADAQIEPIERWYTTLLEGATAVVRMKGPLTAYGRAQKARQQLRNCLGEIIRTRREQGNLTESRDVMGLFLAATDEEGEGLSESQIIDELVHLLNGAHFTTATALTWMLIELAARRDWRERLRQELQQVAGDAPLELAHLGQLTQMNWFLKEIERFYSPAGAVLFRGVRERFEFGGYEIPSGWVVVISPFVSHRVAELFANPDQFDPDRFAPSREEDRKDPFALIGFGAGPHVCIGRQFATMELKIALATLLRGYDWSVTPAEQAVTPLMFPAKQRDLYRGCFSPLKRA
jgi:retinoid hydroxylase